MKLIETSLGDVRVFPLGPSAVNAASDRERARQFPHFRVAVSLTLGDGDLVHEISASVSVPKRQQYSDRWSVEDEAIQDLPWILREAADLVERSVALRGRRVTS